MGCSDAGRWVDSEELAVCDELLLFGGNTGRITAISSYPAEIKVYNFTVGEYHNYAVADAGVLVHNRALRNELVNPLDGTKYTPKVLRQMEPNPVTGLTENHGFPKIVDDYAIEGRVSQLTGGDGIPRIKVELDGSFRGKDGVFEWIIESDNTINHRLFRPDRKK